MTKKVAILQSNYIPWKGYFDMINRADEFILLDDVQYTKNDWRNRNQIKTAQGPIWLTIPVRHVGLSQKIRETQIALSQWPKKHWQAIQTNYAKAPCFKEHKDWLQSLYLNCNFNYLSEINYYFIRAIVQFLNIHTRIRSSRSFDMPIEKNERLIYLTQQVQGQEYLSGPSAQSYLDVDLFARYGIKVTWMNYQNYPEYRQLFPPFSHQVSILDLILNEGKQAKYFLKSFQS